MPYSVLSLLFTGESLSRELFGSNACDLIVGMPNGCPDTEIMAQALVAQDYRKLYFTGRGPRSVLTRHGTNQRSVDGIRTRAPRTTRTLIQPGW